MAHVSIMMSNKVSLPVSLSFWLVGEEVSHCEQHTSFLLSSING